MAAAPDGWLACDGGLVGSGTSETGFAFDNERPAHRTFLEPFELALRPVTCGEVVAFIEDGGYRRPDLWLSAGCALAVLGGAHRPRRPLTLDRSITLRRSPSDNRHS